MRSINPGIADKLNLDDTLSDYEKGFIDGVNAALAIRRPSPADMSAAVRLLQRACEPRREERARR